MDYYMNITGNVIIPQTPAIHAFRGDRYKCIHYYGLWDTDELYDLKEDPYETKNLINDKELQNTVRQMNKQLFEILKNTNGMYIPLYPDNGGRHNLRFEYGSPALYERDSTVK